MSDCECIRISDHGFTGSAAVRKMFLIEYRAKPLVKNGYHKDMVVLAENITEALSIIERAGFRDKIDSVEQIKELGTCIDMKLLPHESKSRFSNIT